MSLTFTLARRALFGLLGDAEAVHGFCLHKAHQLQDHPGLLRALAWWYQAERYRHPVQLGRLELPGRIGLAAGVDKQGRAPLTMQALGFDFVVIGSVLAFWQEGNPSPRLFSLEEDGALINRFGFNSPGVLDVVKNLGAVRSRLHVPLGVSVGIMKETAKKCSVEAASQDYNYVIHRAWDHADFFVLCVSSPNTPHLRDLQSEQHLGRLLKNVIGFVNIQNAERRPPKPKAVLVKIAPDIAEDVFPDVVRTIRDNGADALVLGNTTVTRPLTLQSKHKEEAGGLSGKPLFPLTFGLLKQARKVDRDFPIIFVGGAAPENVGQIFNAGANAIKTHTSFVRGGPQIVWHMRKIAARHGAQ